MSRQRDRIKRANRILWYMFITSESNLHPDCPGPYCDCHGCAENRRDTDDYDHDDDFYEDDGDGYHFLGTDEDQGDYPCGIYWLGIEDPSDDSKIISAPDFCEDDDIPF